MCTRLCHFFVCYITAFFAAESIIDKAIEVRFIGGVYGNQRPTEFLCLLLKLLQIQPEKEILVEYLRAEEFKLVQPTHLSFVVDIPHRYLRALAALYIRMTFRAVDVYELLEPLLKDYRKLRLRNMGMSVSIIRSRLTDFTPGGYTLTFIDEFVYSLLTEERVCDIILPRMAKRQTLEENGDIGPRKSRLLAAMEDESDNESGKGGSRSPNSRSGSRSRASSPTNSQRSKSRSRSRSRTPSEAGSRYVSRSPSRSRSRSFSPKPDGSRNGMDIDEDS